DRVAAWFVHGVIILALVTFAVWYFVLNKSLAEALEYAVAVLLVSCPCALGLATPMAVTVGSGKALDNGILFKEASALETIGRIKYAAMDKTGTVTAGTPEVTSVTSVSDISTKHILHLAGILECFSNHPLAGAITAKSGIKTPDTYGLMDEEMTDIIRTVFMEQASSGILSIRDFSEVSSGGVQALINNHRVYLGKLGFIKEKVVVSPEVSATCGDMARKGETVLLLATASKVLGIITVNDTVRPNAAEAVAVLYRDGIIPVMLTGDNLHSAIGVAERVNIKNVRSDCLPTTKATIIRDLKARGMTAMVGDGINDALPLTEADVGIAVGSGSEIARDAGSVVLVNSDPLSLIKAIRCGRLTLKVI
ncbi:HAD-IC family P-type ATPase, partial [Ruminobacter sp.]|uniref:HAD-IC family P-type ATPase n=1 Tax=Ruminobacter sp. TaxID=2774296 RepID=UPI00386B54F5